MTTQDFLGVAFSGQSRLWGLLGSAIVARGGDGRRLGPAGRPAELVVEVAGWDGARQSIYAWKDRHAVGHWVPV
ncbi:hypothetical protein GCM10011428_44840 [Streptomyces violaceus]